MEHRWGEAASAAAGMGRAMESVVQVGRVGGGRSAGEARPRATERRAQAQGGRAVRDGAGADAAQGDWASSAPATQAQATLPAAPP